MPDPSHDDITQDLLTNPRYAELFAPYHPEAVARFAASYAGKKFMWQWRGPQAEASHAHALGQSREAAYSRLWDIQRKKLFDLQCRWRAGQADVPGVACSYDFGSLDVDIENCPVLAPISPEELAMYCDFVRQASDFVDDVLDAYRDEGDPRDWQDYDALRLDEEEFEQDTPDDQRRGDTPPAWYDFHNGRTGHGFLLRLPDLRGPLEKRYLQAYYAHLAAKGAAPAAAAPPADPRPTFLTFEQETALEQTLLRAFETPKLRRQQAAYAAAQAREEADQQLTDDVAFLQSLGPEEAVPVEAAPDWRQALRQAVVETRRRQLLALLPEAYDDYCLREQQGIRHPQAEEPRWRHDMGRHYRNLLLDGREALGEPRDFNF